MSILNTINTPIGISAATASPGSGDNISTGYVLGQEWYNTTTGDKFYHKFDGVWVKYENSSTSALTEVTYSELVALIGSSSLVTDRTYLLTDYQTTWEDSNTGATFSSGVIEPLYITATDVNELSKECKSELYPQDIVYYEVTGDINDGNGTEGFTKGKIYRRIDTISNNDIGTDWRHVQYRRYAMKVENPWTIGNSYIVGDIVDDSGSIYICIDAILDSQSLSDGNWFEYPAANGEYAGRFNAGNYEYIIGNNITVPIDIDDHQDFYLFDFVNYYNQSEAIYNNTIESYALTNTVITSPYFYENNIGSYFNNNHITSYQFNANEFARGFSNNSIYSGYYYYNDSSIAAFSSNICIGNNFRVNSFSNEVVGNVFTNDFSGNDMDRMVNNYITSFYDNLISNSFNNNTLKSGWSNNTANIGYISNCKSSGGDGVVNNLFSGTFNTNIIKDEFAYNRLSGFVQNNTFNGNFIANENTGEEFADNTFLGVAERNIIGSNFTNNTLGQHFSRNTIGNGFNVNTTGENFQYNNIGSTNYGWNFRSNTNHFTILNEINGAGRNIPYIPGTYDKTIRLSNEVLKCDYVDEHSDIIFQEDNTGPTFTFKSDREDLYLYAENKTFPVSGIVAITPFIVDWGDVVNPLVEDIVASDLFNITHTYSGKLNTDLVEVAMIGKYIRYIELYGNQITEFDLTNNISQYVEYLDLSENLLTYFNPTVALPNSLTYLTLYDNQLTGFDPSIALPGSLLSLQLSLNQITSFDTSIALPSVLQYLYLSYNQLSYFDPSIALPNSLEELYFDNNLLTSFNPTSHSLPSSLVILNLEANQLDTTAVNNTLIMLNTTYTVAGSKTFTLNMSPPATPDGAGLTAKSELQAKGYTVYTD